MISEIIKIADDRVNGNQRTASATKKPDEVGQLQSPLSKTS